MTDFERIDREATARAVNLATGTEALTTHLSLQRECTGPIKHMVQKIEKEQKPDPNGIAALREDLDRTRVLQAWLAIESELRNLLALVHGAMKEPKGANVPPPEAVETSVDWSCVAATLVERDKQLALQKEFQETLTSLVGMMARADPRSEPIQRAFESYPAHVEDGWLEIEKDLWLLVDRVERARGRESG